MTIEFTIPGVPVPKGRPRSVARIVAGHPVATVYTPEKTRKAEMTLAARAMEFRPGTPLAGPIRLDVNFDLPIPDSWPQWKRDKARAGEYLHVSKPDADNLLKLLKDALCGVFWLDDRQIFQVSMSKRYSAVPQTRIGIYEVPQAERDPRDVQRSLAELSA